MALAVDLRDDSFSVASFELTGRGTMLERRERAAGSGADLLTGLAERLALVGGHLEHHTDGQGDFVLRAGLPISQHSPATASSR